MAQVRGDPPFVVPQVQELPEGTVTILFTDVEGSTELTNRLGDAAARGLMGNVEALARTEIAKHRGFEVKGTGDGLMVAFQSARRAVDCATGIQQALEHAHRGSEEAGVQLRIGLNTGDVVREGSDLFGATVNAAARIESQAEPGQVLISDTTRALLGTGSGIAFIDRGDVILKGFDQPWRLWEVPWDPRTASERGAGRDRTPYVGREQERDRLRTLAQQARDGVGALVLIGGEAGVGKTRLADELADEARRLGLLTLTGQCHDMESAQPYLPFIEMVQRAMAIVPADRLRDALGDSAPEVARLLPELRQRFDDIPEPIALPPEQEQRYLLNGLRDYLERAARVQPMLLVFEDLQWADDSTLRLVEHLGKYGPEMRILTIATYREDEAGPDRPLGRLLQNLLRQRLAEELLLRPLTRNEVGEVLRGHGGGSPPEQLLELVYSETDGNPFFIEELLRHLNEAGKLFDEDGRWRRDIQIDDDEVPRGVRLVIGQRLQRVSEECRRVLTSAAILGRNFDFDLLATLVAIEDDQLLDALDAAEHATLVRDISRQREARYTFVHEQIRQALLQGLSGPRRQRLHLHVADAMERFYGPAADEQAAQLAHHLFQAGAGADGARTARYLLLAAERARGASAFEEAVQMLDAAGTVLSPNDVAATANVRYLRGLCLRGLSKMEEALDAFQQSLDLLPAGDDRDQVVHARAQLLMELFRGNEAVGDLEELLASARQGGDKVRELEYMLGLGRAYYIISLNESGGGERALEAYEQAYALGKEIGDKRGMARALIPTHWLADYWPEFRTQAAANVAEAVALADDVGDEELILDAAEGRLRFMTPGEATPHMQRLRERVESRRDPVRLKEFYFSLMWHYLRIGEFEESVAISDAATRLAEELGAHPVQYPTIKALALINLGRYGDAWDALEHEVTDEPFGRAMQQFGTMNYLASLLAFDRTAAEAEQMVDAAKRLDRAWMQVAAHDTRVAALAQLGPVGRDVIDQAERELRDIGVRLGRHAQAEASLSRGELDDALELATGAAISAEQDGRKENWIDALELTLRILLALGHNDEALAGASAALQHAEELDYRSMLWRIRAARARARAVTGDEDGAAEDYGAAADLVQELAKTIPSANLRSGFENSPLVTRVLSAADGGGQ